MSIADLRAKYGSSKNSRRLVNAAIRAEIPGGNEALDALVELQSDPVRLVTPAGQLAERLLQQIIEAQAAAIASRYGLHSEG